jgi:hypothetical protein
MESSATLNGKIKKFTKVYTFPNESLGKKQKVDKSEHFKKSVHLKH